jgi:hypothetical protein
MFTTVIWNNNQASVVTMGTLHMGPGDLVISSYFFNKNSCERVLPEVPAVLRQWPKPSTDRGRLETFKRGLVRGPFDSVGNLQKGGSHQISHERSCHVRGVDSWYIRFLKTCPFRISEHTMKGTKKEGKGGNWPFGRSPLHHFLIQSSVSVCTCRFITVPQKSQWSVTVLSVNLVLDPQTQTPYRGHVGPPGPNPTTFPLHQLPHRIVTQHRFPCQYKTNDNVFKSLSRHTPPSVHPMNKTVHPLLKPLDCPFTGSFTYNTICRVHGDVTYGGLWELRITSHNTVWLIDSPLDQGCKLWLIFFISNKNTHETESRGDTFPQTLSKDTVLWGTPFLGGSPMCPRHLLSPVTGK